MEYILILSYTFRNVNCKMRIRLKPSPVVDYANIQLFLINNI